MLQARWQLALSTASIVAVTIVPFAVSRRFQLTIPPEFDPSPDHGMNVGT